jgi:hypothetical protein
MAGGELLAYVRESFVQFATMSEKFLVLLPQLAGWQTQCQLSPLVLGGIISLCWGSQKGRRQCRLSETTIAKCARSVIRPAEVSQFRTLCATAENLDGHDSHTDYAGRLSEGRVIGSGLVEAACNQAVGRRLKQTGARWKARRVERMATLCAVQAIRGTHTGVAALE